MAESKMMSWGELRFSNYAKLLFLPLQFYLPKKKNTLSTSGFLTVSLKMVVKKPAKQKDMKKQKEFSSFSEKKKKKENIKK